MKQTSHTGCYPLSQWINSKAPYSSCVTLIHLKGTFTFKSSIIEPLVQHASSKQGVNCIDHKEFVLTIDSVDGNGCKSFGRGSLGKRSSGFTLTYQKGRKHIIEFTSLITKYQTRYSTVAFSSANSSHSHTVQVPFLAQHSNISVHDRDKS